MNSFFVFINSTVASESRQGTETCMMIHTHIPLVDISGLFSGLSKKKKKKKSKGISCHDKSQHYHM